jgi:hypothetical protein
MRPCTRPYRSIALSSLPEMMSISPRVSRACARVRHGVNLTDGVAALVKASFTLVRSELDRVWEIAA